MIILVIVKYPRPTIAPVQGMITKATHGSARCSRHEVILTATPTRGKQIPRPNSPHASTSFTSLSGPSVNIDRVSLRRTLNVPVFPGWGRLGLLGLAHNTYIEPKSYASTEQGLRLRSDAMALRGRLRGDTTYRNVATAEVTINGRTTTVKFANTKAQIHSEEKLVAWYQAMRDNGKSVTVNAVYTDRNPCRVCDSLMANTFGSDLTVYRAQGSGSFGKLW